MWMNHVTLAVLGGGLGRRMGGPKTQLRLNGQPILQHLHRRLNWPGPTMLVTARALSSPVGSELFDAEYTDSIDGQGPMLGILTALQNSSTKIVVVIPVDMPNLDRSTLLWLARQQSPRSAACGTMMKRPLNAHEQIEPLPAAFSRARAIPLLGRHISAGQLALHRLPESAQITIVPAPDDLPQSFWTNLNYPNDLNSYESIQPLEQPHEAANFRKQHSMAAQSPRS